MVRVKHTPSEVERQTANETSEQTEDREHVGRDHAGRDHVATTHRLTRSSSEAIRQPTSSATIRHLFCSVEANISFE